MQIYILLTEECNLSCMHCIRGSKKNNYMDLSSFTKMLAINDFSEHQVLLTGGEPMLHPQFAQFLTLCTSAFKHVSINTNGTLLENMPPIHSPNLHIQISLDGYSSMHNMLRGRDTYEKILSNVRMIDALGYGYNIASVVNKLNYKDISKLIPVLYGLKGMKYWKVEPELPFGCGNLNDCIDVHTWNMLVDNLVNESPFMLRIKKLFDFSALDALSEEERNQLSSRKSMNCGGCKNKIYIYPDFMVYPCTCLTNFPIGNIRYNTFKEILNSAEAKVFINYELDDKSQCKKCKYVNFCNGGCIGSSYKFYGKLGMGDARCPLLH